MKTNELANAQLTRRTFFKLSAVTAFGATIVGLAGCGSSSAASSATAGSSSGGTLTMLNYADWMGVDEVENFAKQYGFTIEELPTPDGGTTAWVNTLTSNKGTYDFALAGNNVAKRLKENNLLADFDASKVPNLSKVASTYTSEFPYGIPCEQGKIGFYYNKRLLSTPPTSYKELFAQASSDALAGKILFPAYDGDVLDAGLLALGYDVNSATAAQIEEARDAVISIKPYVKAFIDSGAPSQIIDGSAAIAVGYDYDYAYAAPESEDIGWIAPSEGCPGYLDGWVPLAGSKNLDAVYQFFNFHLEDENYADFINTTMASWIIPEVKSLLDPDVANCEALDPEKNPGTFYTQNDADKTAQYAAAWQAIQNA